MRYRLAALMLMAVLMLISAMILPAAPVPEPSAVLDIGPPQSEKTSQEQHCKQVIESLKHPRGYFWNVEHTPDVKKLASAVRLKTEEVGPWLARNFRIKEEDGGRRLRITFRAGTRAEQVTIINALLGAYIGGVKQSIKTNEEFLHPLEKRVALYAKASKEEREPQERVRWQKKEANMKKVAVPVRDEVTRLKQINVIKWAK